MPLRNWSIEIFLIGPHGEEIPATCFDKVVYNLHETFKERQVQSTSKSDAEWRRVWTDV